MGEDDEGAVGEEEGGYVGDAEVGAAVETGEFFVFFFCVRCFGGGVGAVLWGMGADGCVVVGSWTGVEEVAEMRGWGVRMLLFMESWVWFTDVVSSWDE